MSAKARDWRDTFAEAADLALLGMLVAVASVPLLTAGAAVATAAEAIDHRWTHGRWPGLRDNLLTFRRRLLPGAVATLAVGLAAAVLLGNLALLQAGVVPGGTALGWATGIIGAGLAGLCGLSIHGLSQRYGMRAALSSGWQLAVAHPLRLLASAGVLAMAILLAFSIPVTAPLIGGYLIFALYAIGRGR